VDEPDYYQNKAEKGRKKYESVYFITN